MNPHPHWDFFLDPHPHFFDADPQHCRNVILFSHTYCVLPGINCYRANSLKHKSVQSVHGMFLPFIHVLQLKCSLLCVCKWMYVVCILSLFKLRHFRHRFVSWNGIEIFFIFNFIYCIILLISRNKVGVVPNSSFCKLEFYFLLLYYSSSAGCADCEQRVSWADPVGQGGPPPSLVHLPEAEVCLGSRQEDLPTDPVPSGPLA
jgi:hypothetical protein